MLTLQGCWFSPSPTPPPTPTTECFNPPESVRLDGDWRFRTDPDDEGLARGWHQADVDDAGWRALAPGEPWEFSGLAYDGVAWYRAPMVLPDWPAVYLGFGAVDDEATLWVNGKRAGNWKGEEAGALFLDLSAFGEPGDELQLAFRVTDSGGYGGIKQPLRLGTEPRAVMTEAQYITWLAASHPSWPMPGWIGNEPFAWTMTGGLQASNEALASSDGAVAPWADAPIVEAWLYDPAADRLISGSAEDVQFSLVRGSLPIPQWTWEAEGVSLESVLFHDVQDDAVRWRVTAQNSTDAPRELTLVLAARPFALNESRAPIHAIGVQGETRLWINGDPFMAAEAKPQAAGVGAMDEAMEAALQGRVPDRRAITCVSDGNAAGVLVYPLRLAPGQPTTFHFAFPSAPGAPFPSVDLNDERRLTETIRAWERVTGQVAIDLPDDLIAMAARASTGYLLLALDPEGPNPGPLAHDAFWVRDAAYIGLALLQTGHADAVRAYIPDFFDDQEASGRIPPIQGDEIPWDANEWDAQGEAIFLVTSYYRYTGERDTLREWYPALRASAQFIVDLRAPGLDTGGPAQGLLPPSKSAEDLGRVERHYYWDDFWAVVGLEEAAYAARELGEGEDAAWMEAEADALREAILASVEAVMGEEPAYIPRSVESVDGSAAARGTVPALWPVEVLPRDMPLIKRSFDYYYRQWIEPDAGGFRHRKGQFWTYGGLELAQAYLRLGRTDVLHEILGWVLTHQTLPGTFAWAEQVHPVDYGFSGGDMPHAWAAAGFVTLVREMLASERGDTLQLFTGTPGWWFEAGRTIALENAPTHFGALSLHTESTVQQTDGGWDGTLTLTVSGATPPGGFRWQLPEAPAAVDGPPGTSIVDGELVIPGGGGTVELSFAGR